MSASKGFEGQQEKPADGDERGMASDLEEEEGELCGCEGRVGCTHRAQWACLRCGVLVCRECVLASCLLHYSSPWAGRNASNSASPCHQGAETSAQRYSQSGASFQQSHGAMSRSRTFPQKDFKRRDHKQPTRAKSENFGLRGNVEPHQESQNSTLITQSQSHNVPDSPSCQSGSSPQEKSLSSSPTVTGPIAAQKCSEMLKKLEDRIKEIRTAIAKLRNKMLKLTKDSDLSFGQLQVLQEKRKLVLTRINEQGCDEASKLESQEKQLLVHVTKLQVLQDLWPVVEGKMQLPSTDAMEMLSHVKEEMDAQGVGKPLKQTCLGLELRFSEALKLLCRAVSIKPSHSSSSPPSEISRKCHTDQGNKCWVEFDKVGNSLEVGEECVVTCSISVQLTDGRLVWYGDDVKAQLEHTTSRSTTQCDVNCHSAGCYCFSFAPVKRGRHTLRVLVGELEVANPLDLYVFIHPSKLEEASVLWNKEHEIRDPSGIAISNEGYVAVAEWKASSIFIGKADNQNPIRVAVASLPTDRIYGVGVDGIGNFYCSERYGNRSKLMKFDRNGKVVKIVEASASNSQRSLAVFRNELFVCDDTEAGSVAVYNLDLKFLESIKVKCDGIDNFHGLAVDECGIFYATDSKFYIRVFLRSGELIRSFNGVEKDGTKIMNTPRYIFARRDRIYVSDLELNKIFVFSSEGDHIGSLGSEGQLKTPWGVWVDYDGFAYVCDSNHHRVLIF